MIELLLHLIWLQVLLDWFPLLLCFVAGLIAGWLLAKRKFMKHDDWKYHLPRQAKQDFASAKTGAAIIALLMALLVLIASCSASASQIPLEWDTPESSPVAITNYTLRIASVSDTNVVLRLETGTNRTFMATLAAGSWQAWVTATGLNGLTSDPSNVVPIVVPPPPVLRLKIQGAAKLDGPWTNFAALEMIVERTNATAFYRGELEWGE